jgi:hypothetical protein
MEKSAIPINSNNQSESSDSDSGYFKTAICVPKKCRKSSSASMYNLNSNILKCPFFLLILIV